MFGFSRESLRPARRNRSFVPESEPLEGRRVLSGYLQTSDVAGGGIYGIDVLGGLAHNQDNSLLSSHLDGLAITTISTGTTKSGADNAFVQMTGSNEIYQATQPLLGILGGGFVDQHVALKTFEDLPGGSAYGIDTTGALYRYQEGTVGIGGGSWSKIGGGGITQFSARKLANGQDAVFVRTVDSKIIEWKQSTGFVDLHGGFASVYASPTGNYSVGYDGSVYFYSDANHNWRHIGGSNVATLAVGTTPTGQEDFYATTTNGSVYYGNSTAIVPVAGKVKELVATSNGGAYAVGTDGALYHFLYNKMSLVGGTGFDSVATGIDSSGQDEVYVHSTTVNLLGIKVGMVYKYQPSVSTTAITPILDLLT